MNRMMLRRRVLMASLMNAGLPLSDLPDGAQAHTSQTGREPPNAPALWVVIDSGHAGTIDNPILAARGMEYEYGKYYLDTEDEKTYLCKRGEETGSIVLYYLPHELIGQYFEEVS